MKYELSERVTTKASAEKLFDMLEAKLRKISKNVNRSKQTLEAKDIEASFGSINRSDKTTFSLTPKEGGWLVTADVEYKPSIAFWIILIISFFSYVFWIIPIIFYLMQRNTVKNAVQECLNKLKNELAD